MSQTETSESKKKKTSWREFPILLIKGFLMGSADIVPGVSGGTMALIIGIYTRLIDAIRSFDAQFLKRLLTLNIKSAARDVDWKFLVMLLSGIGCAVFFFTRIVPLQLYMFTDPEVVFGLFFGLILGSIFILAKALDGFNWLHGLMIVIGIAIGFWVVTLVPTKTSESPLFVFLSGAIAICAMILPGISGSYILLILRKYDFILSQVSKLGTANTMSGLLTLLPFVLGAIVGLALFSRVLSWLLNRYSNHTLAVLIGFLIGSLYVIWPYQNRTYTEIVTKQKVVAYSSPKVQALRKNPPEENRPEFQRLGRFLNPNAADAQKKVQLQTVKKKLIKSSPFLPYITVEGAGTDHFGSGILGGVIGLIMVVGLDYLRSKN
ncbi:MAG TPA: DUF368 domain-containing protein [Balneolaceae bacterium]|nr:DUF368 domain-containing protein [Balneolaceae bacterium]